MRSRGLGKRVGWALSLVLTASLLLPAAAQAKTAAAIEASANAALGRFVKEVKGGRELLQAAKGVLVFGGVIKAGVGIGAEYGEGVLRIGGRTVAYYRIASASIGLQFGAQRKDIVILFLQDKALRDFRASQGWRIGVDGSVVLVDVGAEASIDSMRAKYPIVAFVVGQKGLMYNLTLEGTRIVRIKK